MRSLLPSAAGRSLKCGALSCGWARLREPTPRDRAALKAAQRQAQLGVGPSTYASKTHGPYPVFSPASSRRRLRRSFCTTSPSDTTDSLLPSITATNGPSKLRESCGLAKPNTRTSRPLTVWVGTDPLLKISIFPAKFIFRLRRTPTLMCGGTSWPRRCS